MRWRLSTPGNAHGVAEAHHLLRGGGQGNIVRTGLLQEPVLSGGSEWSVWLRPGETLSPSAGGRVEGLGHDVRGTRVAVSVVVSDMIAGSALCVRHDPSPRGRSEVLTIPFPSSSPQSLTDAPCI